MTQSFQTDILKFSYVDRGEGILQRAAFWALQPGFDFPLQSIHDLEGNVIVGDCDVQNLERSKAQEGCQHVLVEHNLFIPEHNGALNFQFLNGLKYLWRMLSNVPQYPMSILLVEESTPRHVDRVRLHVDPER